MMESRIIQLPSAVLACELYGEGKVSLVIEVGLGAVMAEWRRFAQRLSERHTVLLYQRAGYGCSGVSTLECAPGNIALELKQLFGLHGRIRHGRQEQGNHGHLPGRYGNAGITDTQKETALGYG